MNRSLIALVLAAALMGSLTACTTRDNGTGDESAVQGSASDNVNNSGGSNVNGSANSGNMGSGSTGGSTGSGSAGSGSMAGDSGSGVVAKGPAGSVYSNGRTNYSRQSTAGQRTGTGNPTVNPYLADGRYRAGDNGRVHASGGEDGRDLTGAARDMVRDTGDALKDMGNGVRDAVRDVTGR